MSKSIVEKNGAAECFVCGWTRDLETHHIFYGNPNRKKSEHYGLKVHLCARHHRSGKGVHGGNREMDLKLKQLGQKLFEEKYNHEKFMEEFGKNWL